MLNEGHFGSNPLQKKVKIRRVYVIKAFSESWTFTFVNKYSFRLSAGPLKNPGYSVRVS